MTRAFIGSSPLTSFRLIHATTAAAVAMPEDCRPHPSLEVVGDSSFLPALFKNHKRPYRPYPIIAWNRHVETIFAAFFRSRPEVRLRRECLRTKDDGAVALDWVAGDDRLLTVTESSPVLILLVSGLNSVFLLNRHIFKEHFDSKVLVNSFDALESEALRAVQNLNLVAIGPLIPSAFLDGKDPSDNSFGGDLFEDSRTYIKWLDSMPNKSVVYAAFGSFSPIAKQQIEEIARGLLACGRPFLWVVRATEDEKMDRNERNKHH